MKCVKNFFVLVFALLAFTSINSVSAQATNNQAEAAVPSTVVPTANTPRVYVTDIQLTKTEFASGDTITGSMTLYNGSDVDAGSVNYSFKLLGAVDAKTKQPTRMYSESNPVAVSIRAGDEMTVPVSFTIPQNVKDNAVVLRAWMALPAGTPLSWKDSKMFKVTSDTTFLKITDAYIRNSIKEVEAYYPLQAGISLYPDKEPKNAKVHFSFTNSNTQAVSFTPVLKVYDRAVALGKLVNEMKGTGVTVAAKANGQIDLDIPTLNYAPGLYEASIEAFDANGVNYFPSMRLRYIIQGDSAIIQSVGAKIVGDTVKKGDAIPVEISVSGTPLDLLTNQDPEATGKQMYDVKVSVKNEKGNVIASTAENAEIGQSTTLLYSLTATAAAKSTSVSVEVSRNGKVLATYDQPLTLEAPKLGLSPLEYMKWGMIMIGVLILLIALFAFFKHHRKNEVGTAVGTMLLLFGILSLFAPHSAPAAQFSGGAFDQAGNSYAFGQAIPGQAEPAHNITISEPFENQRIPSGTPYTVRGTHIINACWNLVTSSEGFERVYKVPTNQYNASCSKDMTGFTNVKGGTGYGAGLNLSGQLGNDQVFAHNTPELAAHAGVLAVDSAFVGKTPSSFAPFGLYYQYVLMAGHHANGRFITHTNAWACQPFWIVPATPTLTADATKECGKVFLSWPAVANVTTYKLYRSEVDNANSYTLLATITGGVLQHTDTTVQKGKTYYYKLTAYHDASLAESNKSNTATAAIPRTCANIQGMPSCTGTVGANYAVTWTANFDSDDKDTFVYTWTGDATGTGESLQTTYSQPTAIVEKSVTVTATDNGATVGTASCDVNLNPPNSICVPGTPGCSGGGGPVCYPDEKFCTTRGVCIGKNDTCPDACTDPVVPTESALQSVNNGSNLCTSLFDYVPGTLFGSSASNNWNWSCRPTSPNMGTVSVPATNCDASCPGSSQFDDVKGYCTAALSECVNPKAIRNTAGECVVPDGRIKYFVANPDTSEVACPTFWDTEVDNGAYLDCNIGGGDVPSAHITTSLPGHNVNIGQRHTLSCDLKLTDDDTYIKTVSASLRCYRPTDVKEH